MGASLGDVLYEAFKIALFCFGVVLIACGIANYRISKYIARAEHKKKAHEERVKQVYIFCENMYIQYGYWPGNELPYFEDMVNDDKPLTAKNYVRIKNVINEN